MDDPFFISRDARHVAIDLNIGNAGGAAERLREDCAHMSPCEFSSLLSQSRANELPGHRADIEYHRDGLVTVRGLDGRQYAAGQLPPEEMVKIFPPPPPPIIVMPPPRVVVEPRERIHVQLPHVRIDVHN